MKPNLCIETKGKLLENDETEPVSPTGQYFNSKSLSICILAILESEVPIDDSSATTLLQDLFLPISPRFSSIMITNPTGEKQWKRVQVNLQDHIKVPTFSNNSSIQSYDNEFDQYLTKISMNPLPKDKPLWEIHILKYPTSKAAGHLIFKLHHALGDGYSLMGALLSCVKRADNPSFPLTFKSTRVSTQQVQKNNNNGGFMRLMVMGRALSTIYRGFCDFGSFLRSSYTADDMTPIRSGNASLGFHPVKIFTLAFSLDQIKLIKTNLGTTVNDAITGIIFLGTRLYMQLTHTEFSKSRSTVTVLYNTRNIGGYLSVNEMMNADTKIWGNKFSYLQILLPELTNKNCLNPLDFVYEAQKLITRYKNSPAVYLTAQYLDIVRRLRGSEAIAENIHSRLTKSSMGITNMIGPAEKVTLANHPIKGMYFMCTGIPKSLTITVMSYTQTLRIAVGVEKGFIDSQRLESCFKNAFEMIYEAATKT